MDIFVGFSLTIMAASKNERDLDGNSLSGVSTVSFKILPFLKIWHLADRQEMPANISFRSRVEKAYLRSEYV